MSQTTAPADRLQKLARKWFNAVEREASVLAAQASSEDPDSQYFELAISRAVGSRLAAGAALIRALPTIPAAVSLDDALVVVIPDPNARPPKPGRRWDPNEIQVLALPRAAVLA